MLRLPALITLVLALLLVVPPTAPALAPPVPAFALGALGLDASRAADAAALGPIEALNGLATLADSQEAAARALTGSPATGARAAQLHADARVVEAAEVLDRDVSPTNVQRILTLSASDAAAAARVPVLVRHTNLISAFDAWGKANGVDPARLTDARAKLADVHGDMAMGLARVFDAQAYEARALAALPGDVPALEHARATVAYEVTSALPLLHPTGVVFPIEICGVLQLDLVGVSNNWDCDAILNVDVGSFAPLMYPDQYANNAGGAGGYAPPAALAIHLGGHAIFDTTTPYLRSGGVAGGASGIAMGALFSQGDGDTYRHGAMDGNSASYLGGGDNLGVGLYVALGGAHNATLSTPQGGMLGGGANGGSGAAFSLNATPSTFAMVSSDLCNSICYHLASTAGAAGSGADGRGLLVTRGNGDEYQFTQGEAGFVAAFGSSVGDGQGLMIALGSGGNRYHVEATMGAALGSSMGGEAALVDLGRANQYTSLAAAESFVTEGSAGAPYFLDSQPTTQTVYRGGIGFLYAGRGNDQHLITGTGQGVGDFFGLGMMVDGTGSPALIANTYEARSACTANMSCQDGTLAQGVGRALGIGILVDGSADPFLALNGTAGDPLVGQAFGLGGVGIVAHAAPIVFKGGGNLATLMTYNATGSARTGGFDGGGIALRLQGGLHTLEGNVPFTGCSSAAVYADTRGVICHAEDGVPRALPDPNTRGPQDPLPGPGIACGWLYPCPADLPVPGYDIVTGVLGESQYNRTLSGGVFLLIEGGQCPSCTSTSTLTGASAVAPPEAFNFFIVVPSGDDLCEHACSYLDPVSIGS